MPSNAEITELVAAAWNARDVDAIIAVTDPEAEYVNAPAAVEPGTRHGHEGIADVFRKQWEGLTSEASLVLERIQPEGEEVVTLGRIFLTIPGSGAEMSNKLALRWTFRDGLILKLEVLGAGSSFGEGLAAAGIGE